MYALIENGQVKQYPYSINQLKQANPNVSFPTGNNDAAFEPFGVYRVFFSTPPAYSETTEALQEGTPVFDQVDQRWTQVWTVRALTATELEQRNQALQETIVRATQDRLDTFAQTRNYDGILSACTYASSSVPKFQAEGQYCVGARDATWAKLYEMLAEVEAGTRPIPSGYQDIEPELPALVWPV